MVSLSHVCLARQAHHPAIAPLSVHQPSRYLACGLDHEQTAEAFADLEHRGAVPEHIVPCPDSDHLHEAIHAEQPFVHIRVLGSLSPKGPLYPS
jgi:hypothetical protein